MKTNNHLTNPLTNLYCYRFPHTKESISANRKKFINECKEVISEELICHIKEKSFSKNSWKVKDFTPEQHRELY